MVLCPSGHDSTTTDFCDVCGAPLDEASSPVAPKVPVAPPAELCPVCGAGRTGRFCEACGHDFAGAVRPPVQPAQPSPVQPSPLQSPPDQPSPARPSPAQPSPARPPVQPVQPAQPSVNRPSASGWLAVVAADPDYYRMVIAAGAPDAASIALPAYCPERRFVLAGQQVRVGRRSASRGLHPEIDLSGPPEDPGVSHLHAVLLAQPGGWAVLDPGSTNGTTLNDDPEPIPTNVAVSLADGDRIHVGAWTTITVHAHPD